MSKNSKLITKLTNKWYYYVNLDHHKTKDCYWYVETVYGLGEEPKYRAYHNGYIIDSWNSPDCDTLEDAEQWMISKLERELAKARLHLEEIIALPEDSEERWWMDGNNKAPKILEYLNG